MEFKTFFLLMKNRISDGADAPEFFKELISMITDVPEEKWDSPKDPSTRLTKTESLRSYSKRGPSKKLARSIIYNLSPETFVESLNTRPKALLSMLAEDYKTYDSAATEENIAEKLADCFVDIIRKAAGIAPKDALEQQRSLLQFQELKARYGQYLCDETSNVCPFPGCGKSLTAVHAGRLMPVFEVAVIDRKKEATIDNLLALCPQCHATYSIDSNPKTCKELIGVKKILIARNESKRLLDGMPLEKGIIGVITKIKKLKASELLDPSLEPKNIREKLNPDENYPLYSIVKGYVDTYYVTLKDIITAADKRGEIDYDEVQDQMRAIYRKLKKAKKTKVEIFNDISEKIHKVSLQDDIYCQIVVAFFIAKCEVFDAITE